MKSHQSSFQEENIKSIHSQTYLLFHKMLLSYGIDTYRIDALEADCSLRRYYRITTSNMSYILMDSAQDPSMRSFLKISKILQNNNIRSPKIYIENLEENYLLLEDFGAESLNNYLNKYPFQEKLIYKLCTQVLINIAKIPTSFLSLPLYNEQKLDDGLKIFTQWYLKHSLDNDLFITAELELLEIFNHYYKLLESLPIVLTLRDFMADNIMILKHDDKISINSIGLLDYQDAMLCNCTYDLVSLLEDARRNIDHKTVQLCKEYFCKQLKLDEYQFNTSYNILSLQRNLRIVGVFNRMNYKYGQSKYLDYLPRVWRHISNTLNNATTQSLKNWFKKYKLL